MKNLICLIGLAVLIALASCSKNEILENSINENTISRNATELSINEIEQNAYDDLIQLVGMGFYIRSVGNFQGRNALQTQGKGQIISVVAPTTVTPPNQLFYVRKPLYSTNSTNLEIFSRLEDAAIGLGFGISSFPPISFGPPPPPPPPDRSLRTYTSAGAPWVGPFVPAQGHPAYQWRFRPNESGNAYLMINSGYNVGNPLITNDFTNVSIRNSNGIITDERPNPNDPFQQFQFIPNDQFIVERVDMNIEGANIVSSNPIVLSERIVDNFPAESASRTLTFNETLQENYSFNQSSAVSYQFTNGASASVSIASIVSIGGNFSVTRGTTQTLQYGTNVTKTISLSESYTVPVPGQTRSVLTFSAIRHTVRVPYTAILRGLNTGKIITINGFFDDVSYSATTLAINNFSITNNVLMSRTSVNPNPKN
ncbi:hypothetical protein [Sphingobacterium chungjuense]|uniref:hypothetical protein n=1 Tax=Sphingobacterium chungjuense TaxID=2675553 RepID=UPI0014096CF1|nr:hypothetical protein [Sphingobacterium chungjuense]